MKLYINLQNIETGLPKQEKMACSRLWNGSNHTQNIKISLLKETGIKLGNISRLNITLTLAWISLFSQNQGAFTLLAVCAWAALGAVLYPGHSCSEEVRNKLMLIVWLRSGQYVRDGKTGTQLSQDFRNRLNKGMTGGISAPSSAMGAT